MRILRLAGALAVVAALAVIPGARSATTDGYEDPDYLRFDLDNMARTTERQGYFFTTPEYWTASFVTFQESFLDGVGRQLSDLADLRVYAGLAQLLPGGNVGDPVHFNEGVRHEVEFLNREGTKLVGYVWPCARQADDGSQAACPGVVITTGSVQATQAMYGWAARLLQAHGYTVLTYDVRGQGASETTAHANGTFPEVVNPQAEINFTAGTVDALRFFLSTPAEPYAPVGWTAARRAEADVLFNADDLEWVNPVAHAVDRSRLALMGHSLGARAVSVVQECSDAYPERMVPAAQLPDVCAGQRFPIYAIVAWDSLSTGVTPVVPAFDHEGDGYFLNPTPTFQPPHPDERVDADSAYGEWRAAGVDACTVTVRGANHLEWSEIPYILSATQYGNLQARYYTLAWVERYVASAPASSMLGYEALRAGPIPAEPKGKHLDHRASLFSGKYRSACHVASPAGEGVLDAPDLRAYAGVAAVGDWGAINAEDEHGRAPQGLLHGALPVG